MTSEIVFTFPDTHSAIAGERALQAASLPVRVMPRPSALGDGCGVCLRVSEPDGVAAERVLRDSDILVEKAYRKILEGKAVRYTDAL